MHGQQNIKFCKEIPGSNLSAYARAKRNRLYPAHKTAILSSYFIVKKLISICLFSCLEIENFVDLPFQSNSFSSPIIEYIIQLPFIILEKTDFLLIMKDVFCPMYYISCKYGPIYVGRRNNFCSSTNALSLFPLNPQIIAFRSTNVNFVFSGIRHKNKQGFFSVGKLGALMQRDWQTVRDIIQQNV